MKQSYFEKWCASIGEQQTDREVAQAAFNQLQEQVMKEIKRERNHYRKALRKILQLSPADTQEGYNEWGEAYCFQRAQDIAKGALEKVTPTVTLPPAE